MALNKKQKEALKAKLDELEPEELDAIKELLGGGDDGDIFEQLKTLTERVTKLETPPAPPAKKKSIFDW